MALAEDAVSVLEQFVQDVANLPAEIAHLLEEIQAKDKTIEDCKRVIEKRDLSIQAHLKSQGMATAFPKDKTHVEHCMSQFDRAQTLQAEKVGLSEKANMLLDRQIKRLDIKIRDLQNEGAIAIDPQLPSLLNNASHRLPNLNPPGSASLSGRGPLATLSGNAGPSTTIANAPIARLVQTNASAVNSNASTSATGTGRHSSPHLQVPNQQQSSSNTTSSSLNPHRSPSSDPKRRRLNNLSSTNHLALPPQGGNLRQSSLGPSTPKPLAGTHQSTRGSSAGPRPSLTNKHQKPSSLLSGAAAGALNPGGTSSSSTGSTAPPKNPRLSSLNPSFKKSSSPSSTSRRRPTSTSTSSRKKSTATTGADGTVDDPSSKGTPPPHRSSSSMDYPSGAGGGAATTGAVDEQGDVDEDDEEEEEEDDPEEADNNKYCICQNVSHGNMVACDNEECRYEWFHWGCVGVTREPQGKWFCPDCRKGVGAGAKAGKGV